MYVFKGSQDHLLVWWFAGGFQMTKHKVKATAKNH